MHNFDQLLQQVIKQTADLTFEMAADGRSVAVIFPDERRQRIFIERQGERYRLTSLVLDTAQVAEMGRSALLIRLWERNRETNVGGVVWMTRIG